MNNENDIERFELLDAGRALGDLSPEEEREWRELSEKITAKHDPALDWIVASLESELVAPKADPIPPALASRIRDGMTPFVKIEDETPAADKPAIDNVVTTERFSFATAAGWAIAACLGILLILNAAKDPVAPPDETASTAAEQRNALVQRAADTDVVFTKFSGTENYAGLGGDVVWSDSDQKGFMRLTDLVTNDPTVAQYQLWIVDPDRDANPVDGGVFDIPAGESEVIIPIDAKLFVEKPKAFVITLEQPGGVVVSKQETVVGIAQPS